MLATRLPTGLFLLLALGAACDETGSADGKSEKSAPAPDEGEGVVEKVEAKAGEEAQAAAPRARGKDDDEDKGSASVTIGGERQWAATRARASDQSTTLRISASISKKVGTKSTREELNLFLQDYKGPGEYQLNPPSGLIGVGLDLDKMQKAEGDDDKQQEAAVESLAKAETLIFMGAKATVTADDGESVDGTFEWKPPAVLKKPSFTEGTFHAVRKK